jgi:hypothetical protein
MRKNWNYICSEEDADKVIEWFFLKSADVDPLLDFLYAPNKAIELLNFTLPGGPPHCRHFSFIS